MSINCCWWFCSFCSLCSMGPHLSHSESSYKGWTLKCYFWLFIWTICHVVGSRCLCKATAKEPPEWLWQRGNASPLYGWVTLATVAISHNSGRRNTSIRPLASALALARLAAFSAHLWNSETASYLLLLAGLFCGSVWIYDGELKWSGRKNYWCLSKYHSSVHLDCTKRHFEHSRSFIICFMSCVY